MGRHLVRQLAAQGVPVRALYNSRQPIANIPGVEWQRHDLLDVYAVEDALQGVTDVYHCAAMVSFLPADKERMLHFNVESTANLVNEALVQGVRKFGYMSSVAALGRSEGDKLITEAAQWEESKYNSTYAQSKYLAEAEVWRGVGEGLDAVIVNPGIILGAGDWQQGSARLMTVVNSAFPFYTGGIASWVDVEDVVKALHMLMESDITDERFILSAGNIAYKDIFTQMAQQLGKKPPHIAASRWMTSLVWRWNMLRHRLTDAPITVTRETARTAHHRSYYDNSKLLQWLPGFAYTPVEDTIARMAQAFVREHAA